MDDCVTCNLAVSWLLALFVSGESLSTDTAARRLLLQRLRFTRLETWPCQVLRWTRPWPCRRHQVSSAVPWGGPSFLGASSITTSQSQIEINWGVSGGIWVFPEFVLNLRSTVQFYAIWALTILDTSVILDHRLDHLPAWFCTCILCATVVHWLYTASDQNERQAVATQWQWIIKQYIRSLADP